MNLCYMNLLNKFMKRKTEILTVGICVYRKDFLKRLLFSLKKQSFKKVLYLFLIDNPYDSKKIISIIKKYKLNCVIYKNSKNLGSYNCYDILLKKSASKYFLRVDDDDCFLEKTYLEALVEKIEKGYDFVLPKVKMIKQTEKRGIVCISPL